MRGETTIMQLLLCMRHANGAVSNQRCDERARRMHGCGQYGLIGRNGVGKTTLLRHMAAYDIEGFPRHHRVMHVRQEIKPSEKSVLQVKKCAQRDASCCRQRPLDRPLRAASQSSVPDLRPRRRGKSDRCVRHGSPCLLGSGRAPASCCPFPPSW